MGKCRLWVNVAMGICRMGICRMGICRLTVEPTLLQDLQARIDKRLVFWDPTLYLEHFLIGRNWQLSVIIGPNSTTENRHSSEASENRG